MAKEQPLPFCLSVLAPGFISGVYCFVSHRAALRTCSGMTHSQKEYLRAQLQEDGGLAQPFAPEWGFSKTSSLISAHSGPGSLLLKASLRTKSNKNFIWNYLEPMNLLSVLLQQGYGQLTQNTAKGRTGRASPLLSSIQVCPTKLEAFSQSQTTAETPLLTQDHQKKFIKGSLTFGFVQIYSNHFYRSKQIQR